MSKNGVGRIALIVSSIVILLSVADWKIGLGIAPEILTILRWGALSTIFGFAILHRSLTFFILIAMLLGAEIGHDFPAFAENLQPLSRIFIKLIKTIIAPLLFATLVVGIAGHSNLKQVGRMGWKSLVYFELVTTIALFIGLLAINISQAGIGIPQGNIENHADIKAPPPQTWQDIILHVFPENIAKSIAEGQVLQIVIFSIIFGIALAMVSQKHRSVMLEWTESLAEVMFKFTKIIMYYVPIGVGAAIAVTVAKLGLNVFSNLFQLLATLYVALLVFILGVLLPIALAFRIPIRRFIKAISEPVSIAFATTSSEAALPRAMEAMIKFGVPPKIVAFVMPTGYSFNLDGTTLYLSLASIFVAQAAGIELTLQQQLVMVFTLMLTSKGVAGVPRASLVILLGTAASFNLPEWPIFVILGIDELMDMARTSVNVTGNCLATVVVAKWEGEFDDQAPFREDEKPTA